MIGTHAVQIIILGLSSIESVQRRATKYILNDYISDYRSRLVKLNLLPLTMLLEFNDICFFIQSLKHISPSNSFNISKYISFSQHHTRSGSFRKLVQPLIRHNRDKQFYFNRLPHLWNSLPPFDLNLSYNTIRSKLKDIFWNEFMANFDPQKTIALTFTPASVHPASPSQNLDSPSCVSTPAKLNHTL